MNNTNTSGRNLKIYISLVLTCLAFFVGIYYGKLDTGDKIEKIKNEIKYVNLEFKKSKITVESISENLIISVDGESIENREIDLNKICE